MRKILAGIDLGSDSLKLVVAESFRNKITILASAIVQSKGIKNGFIVEPMELIPRLKELFKKGEDMLGLPIRKVIASIPSTDAKFHMNEGYSTIESNEQVIRSIDLIRAMQASVYNQIEEYEELSTIMPISYKVDEEPVANPVGMKGKKCTVKTIFTTVPKKNVFPIIKCLEKIGVEVIDTTFGCVGDYFEFQNSKLDESVGAIINLGHTTTTISIFNKAILTNTITLNMGAEHIENDLSYIFKVPKKEARDIRLNLCLAHKRGISASNRKEYTTKTKEKIVISEYEATEVASSRIEEILKLAKKQINLLTKKEIHYIIITGGISEMSNFNYLVEEIFGHFAKIGTTKELGLRNNIYSTTIGFVKYYLNKLELRNQEFTIFTEEEQEELSGSGKKININDNSILGKLFGYFFDN